MNRLTLNDLNENNAYAPKSMWDKVNELGWYWKAKNESANDDLADELLARYNDVNDIVELQNFVVNCRTYIQGLITGYYKASPKDIREKLNMSDDGLWDLCSHIVGLGDVMYYYTIDHLDIVLELQKDVRENFEYGFDKAIYELQYKNNGIE